MKSWILVVGVVGSFIALGGFVRRVDGEVHPAVRDSGLDAHETHASASLLGQFRTNTSSWLWLRTDLYLHNGVEMRPLSEQEIKRGKKGVGSTDKHAEGVHDDSKITTVIPSAEDDFRGIFGDLDRATKSYKDMKNHSHNDSAQALPLFRLMTWVDPQFIPGWQVGSHVLGLGEKKRPGSGEKAIKMLEEGLEHNPKSVALLAERGKMEFRFRKDAAGALAWMERCVAAGGHGPAVLMDEEDQEALLVAHRWISVLHRDSGDLVGCIRAADRGLRAFPNDAALLRLKLGALRVRQSSSELGRVGQGSEGSEALDEDEGEHDHDHHDHDHEH